MNHERPWWLVAVESHPCPVCGADVGQQCKTATGNRRYEPHADRTRQGNRCARCGSQLRPDDDGLCPRCELVRSLEVERATKYQRRTDTP